MPCPVVVTEDVGLLEAVAGRVDLVHFEGEVRLVDVHLPTVETEHEVGSGLSGFEGEPAGVTTKVEDTLADEVAAVMGDDRVEEVGCSLLGMSASAGVGVVAAEVEVVVPVREASDPFDELRVGEHRPAL